MTKVNFKRTLTDDEVNNIELEDGNFIVTAEGTAYVDYNTGRKKLGVGDKEYIYFTESTTLNDLVIKSNLLGNNSKIDASEIAIINSDNSVKKLDEYLEETSTISNTQETLVGYWVDSSGVKHERYQKELRFSVNSINPGNEFQLNISNVDKFLKIETYYEVDGGFVPLPFSSNVSNPGQTLSARILKDPERVGLFGNLSYGGAGTFIIRVEYTKTSESE